MKYIYKLEIGDINVGQGILNAPKYEKHCFGGSFLPCEGEYEEHPLRLSPCELISKYRDYQHEHKRYLAGFFGGRDKTDTGYIGKWDSNIDNGAKIYYILMEDGPHKLFIVKFNGLSMSNILGIQYVVEVDGNMMDCFPEDGDILFDNFEEAQTYYNSKEYRDILQQNAIQQVEAEKTVVDDTKPKPITILGDGTYIGQQAGYIFYYQGYEFISPIKIDTEFPTNQFINIKDGKVTYLNWETKIK